MTIYLSPNRRLASLRDAMNRMMEETMTESNRSEREMVLAVDVTAEEEAFVLRALIPGLEADDLSIEILNNTVTLRGEFPTIVDENTRYLICELPQGRFSRVVSLPTAVDAAKTEASLKNGVLTLRVPKAEAHRPKTIKINNN